MKNGQPAPATPPVIVKFTFSGTPPGRLAEAELQFTEGPLEGLKLIGFAVWERRSGNGRNVTFPARQYSINGERRSFALLRPQVDAAASDRLRDLILDALQVEEARRAQENGEAIAQQIAAS